MIKYDVQEHIALTFIIKRIIMILVCHDALEVKSGKWPR